MIYVIIYSSFNISEHWTSHLILTISWFSVKMLLVSMETLKLYQFRRSTDVGRHKEEATIAASRHFFQFVLKCHRDVASLGHLLTANNPIVKYQ